MRLNVTASPAFTDWLRSQKISLAFTTYQTGKLFLIGLQPNGRLSIFERTFNRCMGLSSDGQTLWMSSLYQLWRFENVLETGQRVEGYDRLFAPQAGYVTGDLDIHDVAVTFEGTVVFINTLFNCVAALSETHSFTPLWRPPFISELAAGDRCHLNGLALKDGRPKYVTSVSQADVADGWRDRREDGGCVIDLETDRVVATGLSMPHSPRWYRDRLWLLNSGTGFLGTVDVETGAFMEIAFCPGYLRGLSFIGDFAVVGTSKMRENRTFSGLPLDGNLASRKAHPCCGLHVVDLNTGEVIHWLRMEGVVQELYDVVTLPGVVRPQALGFKTDEVRRVLRVGDPSVCIDSNEHRGG